MALVDTAIEQFDLSSAKRWLKPSIPTAKRSRPAPLRVQQAEPLSAAVFVEELDSLSRQVTREEAMNAMVQLQPAEVRALVRQAAKAKGRYLAALLEVSKQPPSNERAIAQLQRLRERHDELATGLQQLRQMIFDGEIDVEGMGS